MRGRVSLTRSTARFFLALQGAWARGNGARSLLALLLCAACERGGTRCSLGEATLVTRDQVSSYDGIALAIGQSRATAVWSHKLGLFAQTLGAGQPSARRVDAPCSGGIAALEAPASARGHKLGHDGLFVACVRPAEAAQEGSLWLLQLDSALRVRAQRKLAALGRDASGAALAASRDTLYLAYADGQVGGPRVLLFALPYARVFVEPLPLPRALSTPEENGREPSLIIDRELPVVAFTVTDGDAREQRHRLMVARANEPVHALREVLSPSPMPTLARDSSGVVLAFRDLPRKGARTELYVARLDSKLRIQDQARAIGRANGRGAPSLALCQRTRAAVVPIDHAGELYVAFHPLSAELTTFEANHQYYESERELVTSSAGCLHDYPLALIAERTEANQPGARLLAAEFRCTR